MQDERASAGGSAVRLPAWPERGQRSGHIQQIILVDRAHHFEPFCIHRFRAQCAGDRATDGGDRVGVPAEVRGEQDGLFRRFRDQSQGDRQGNDVLRLVGKVVLRNLIDS